MNPKTKNSTDTSARNFSVRFALFPEISKSQRQNCSKSRYYHRVLACSSQLFADDKKPQYRHSIYLVILDSLDVFLMSQNIFGLVSTV